jgi:hypothetical protein
MFKGVDWNQVLVAILAIGILCLSGYFVYSIKTPATESTMDVSGTAQLSVDPDKAEVYFSVETLAMSAEVSQQDNAKVMQDVRSALADLGIKATDMETTSYSLYPDYEYDRNGSMIFKGYKTVQSTKITLSDLSKAGPVADTVVVAGANRVDNIVFGLTDAKRDQIKAQVVNMSIDNAKQKADSQSARMGVKITKVRHFSESSVYVSPYITYEKAAIPSAAPSTEVTPGQIDVTAAVSVTYQIE